MIIVRYCAWCGYNNVMDMEITMRMASGTTDNTKIYRSYKVAYNRTHTYILSIIYKIIALLIGIITNIRKT